MSPITKHRNTDITTRYFNMNIKFFVWIARYLRIFTTMTIFVFCLVARFSRTQNSEIISRVFVPFSNSIIFVFFFFSSLACIFLICEFQEILRFWYTLRRIFIYFGITSRRISIFSKDKTVLNVSDSFFFSFFFLSCPVSP